MGGGGTTINLFTLCLLDDGRSEQTTERTNKKILCLCLVLEPNISSDQNRHRQLLLALFPTNKIESRCTVHNTRTPYVMCNPEVINSEVNRLKWRRTT